VNELEAKFLVAAGKKPKGVFRRVLQELSWAGYLARPKGPTLVIDTYFDSPESQLQSAGWTYRVRQNENGQTLTLKQIAAGHRGVFNREEIEQPLIDPLIRAEFPPPGAVADMLTQLLPEDLWLNPLFELQNHRTRYHLTHPEHPGALIELTLDQVDVDARDSLAYTELEFELRQGPDDALNDLLVVLEQQPNLIRARVGKFQRGLLANGCETSEGTTITHPITNVKCRWVDLGLQHLREQLLLLKLYEPLAWESVHPEGVHQMRVVTRRVRAGLPAFANVLPPRAAEKLTKDIRWLTRNLGPIRDLDVHLEHLHIYQALLSRDERPSLFRYQRHLEKRRREAHRSLLKALASDEYAWLVKDFDALLVETGKFEGPNQFMSIREAAEQQVRPILDRVLRKGQAIEKSSPPEKLHRLRIDVKRLRYQLEYLRSPYGKPMTKAAKALKRLQNTLGNHQDAYVAIEQLQGFCDHTSLNRVERKAFKQLIALEEANAATHRSRFQNDWQRFEGKSAAVKHLI
jgi:triphosphatase